MEDVGTYFHQAGVGNIGPVGGINSGAVLFNVVVGTGVATAVVTIYDGQDNTGKVVAVINGATPGFYSFNCRCHNGVFIAVTVAAADVTAVIE